MQITAEKIKARIAELQKAKDKALADANAYSGALQDCEHWLAELEREESEAHN